MSDRKDRMPVIFVGHGSPMNAIQDNPYTKSWKKVGKDIPKPKAILAVSAHWYTNGSRISDIEQPKLVYDMYGFPNELYQVKYPVSGDSRIAHRVQELTDKKAAIDNSWGIDHGIWSVLCNMFPKADIPVIELSVDRTADAKSHFKLGQDISTIRDEGILILASGNVVHNLVMADYNMEDRGYQWAEEFDAYIKEKILQKEFEDVIHYKSAGENSVLAFQTPDHFYPLLYALGAVSSSDKVSVFNESCTLGALSMTSYLFG